MLAFATTAFWTRADAVDGMDESRRRLLAVGGAAAVGALAGCAGSPVEVPSMGAAAGVGGGPTRFAYAADDVAIPSRPQVVVGRIEAAASHGDALPASASELFGDRPLSAAVRAAVDVESLSAYAKVAGARAFVGVDTEAARATLEDRAAATTRTEAGVRAYRGQDWEAAVVADGVVEAAAPLAGTERERRQYVDTLSAARRGSGARLLERHQPARRVANVLPAAEYATVTPTLSSLDFESEAFAASVRGERTLLATARLATPTNDPSKRNARLQVVERWADRLAPDAEVSNVTVVKRDDLIRVTGTVPTATLARAA